MGITSSILGTFILGLLIFSMVSCAPKHAAQLEDIEPEPGEFFSGEGKPLDGVDLKAHLEDKDFILVGESHDNPCDHKVQARIMNLLSETGSDFVLGLEMVGIRGQEVLDEFNRGEIDLAELPEKLDWEKNWGHEFDLYEPVFRKARELGVPVKALNLPPGISRQISHHGLDSLGWEERIYYLPDEIISPPEAQIEFLQEQFGIHQDFIPEDRADVEQFIQAQSAWDTQMARMALYWKDKTSFQVVVLAGSEHVRQGWGIEHRLQEMDPEASITRVMPVRDLQDIGPDEPFYFFCPPRERDMRLGLVAREDKGEIFLQGVVQDSIAEKAGLRKGDVILQISGRAVSELADLHHGAMEAMEAEAPLKLEIRRNGEIKVFELDVSPEE